MIVALQLAKRLGKDFETIKVLLYASLQAHSILLPSPDLQLILFRFALKPEYEENQNNLPYICGQSVFYNKGGRPSEIYECHSLKMSILCPRSTSSRLNSSDNSKFFFLRILHAFPAQQSTTQEARHTRQGWARVEAVQKGRVVLKAFK